MPLGIGLRVYIVTTAVVDSSSRYNNIFSEIIYLTGKHLGHMFLG